MSTELVMSNYSILFSFLFLFLLVLLLYKFVSAFSAALPSFFTSGFFTNFFANLRILPRHRPCCCTAGCCRNLLFDTCLCLYGLFSSIFGGIAIRVDILHLDINVLLFGSLTCVGLVLFTITILSHGGIFSLINLQLM